MAIVRWDRGARWTADEDYGAWMPPVDIFERGEALVIRAEIPGVQSADVDVRVENGVLTLQGQRSREEEVEERNAFRLERQFGAFTRSFILPRTVDASKIGARLKDGVLEITLPKAEEAKPKKVLIQSE